MNRLLVASALAFALFSSGCCTARDSETHVSVDSYKRALQQIRSNLVDDIRPGYKEALERSDLLPDTFPVRLGLVDDTITLIDGTLAGATEGEQPASQPTSEGDE